MVYKSSSIAASGTSGGSGGGSINTITSSGGTITVGTPTGPTTNIDVANNTANTLAGYNNSGVFSDVAIGTNLSLIGGVLTATAGSGAVSSVFGRTGAVSANYGDYAFNLISGVASVSQGGTGVQALSLHGVLLGEGTANISAATTGIAARILIDQGNTDPSFLPVSGDISMISTGAHTVLAVHGVTYPSSPSTGFVPVVTGSNTVTYELVPNTSLANSAITIGAQTGLAGGGSVALGSAITLSMGTNVANTLAGYNSSGVFSDVSIGTNLNLISGVLSTSAFSAGSNITITYSTNTIGIASSGGGSVSSVFGRTGAVTANWNDYQFNLIGGVASVSQGGTGLQTLTSHAVLLGEGVSNVSFATTGTAGRLLLDQGNADPSFKVMSGDATIASTGAISIGIGAITYNKIQTEAAYTALGNNTGSVASTAAISSFIIGTPGYSATGYNFMQFTGNANSYAQISLQNSSAGSSASADFVLTSDDGSDSVHYADFGKNNSVTGGAAFTNPHAAYLYDTDNELDIGALGASGVVNFYTTGGVNAPVKAGFFDASQNLNLTNALAVAQGGTGQKTYTDGQLLIGNSSTTGLTPSTLSAGASISITNGHGVIGVAYTGATAGVSSLNSITGAATITAGTNITVSSAGSTLTIASSAGGSFALNSITNAATITAGSNITITSAGSTLTIASTGGGTGISLGLGYALAAGNLIM